MLTADAIKQCGSRAAIARALNITKGAVSQWGDVVPYASAKRLAELYPDALSLNESLYDEWLRPHGLEHRA